MEFNFYNTLLTALAVPEKGIELWNNKNFNDKGSKTAQKKQVKRTRIHLLGSQQFAISNSLVRHATKASYAKPKSLLEMSNMAIPPFENMFIEWNEKKRTEALLEMGVHLTSDEEFGADVVGYHIYKGTDGCYYYDQYFKDQRNEKVRLSLFGMMMTNEGSLSDNSRIHLSHELTQKTRHTEYKPYFDQFFLRESAYLLGLSYSHKYGVTTEMLDMPENISLKDCVPIDGVDKDFQILSDKMATCDRASGKMIMGERYYNYVDNVPQTHPIRTQNLTMHTGDMRFLIALLALINYPHILVQRDQIDNGLKTRAYGRNLLKKEVKVLEINLPKPRGVTQYERMFKGYGSPKRQHVRRGHFRTIKYKDGSTSTKWISEQTVGDPKLGFIDHKYLLTHKNVA